jgi:broad specificity phosphatase PhoE
MVLRARGLRPILLSFGQLSRSRVERFGWSISPKHKRGSWGSAIRRAHQTADAIADRRNLVPNKLPGLAESDFGELEGRRFEEIASTHPDLYATWMSRPTKTEFPEGERFADFSRRARKQSETSDLLMSARRS